MDESRTEAPSVGGAPVEVLLAEAHPVARAVLAGLIRSDGRARLTRTASNGRAAVRQANQTQVAVLDARLPLLDGLSALTAIRREDPAAQVIILLPADAPYLRSEARRRGATAVLTYAEVTNDLLPAILGGSGSPQRSLPDCSGQIQVGVGT